MEGTISTIKKLDLKKEDIQSVIMLDKDLSGTELKFLEDEFDFYREDVNRFAANYKTIGVIFKLTPIKTEFMKDWKIFLQKVIRRTYSFDKFDNIFVNNTYDKVLVVSNKRLLNIDLKKLNEKIEEINYRIESHNEKAMEEMKSLSETNKEEHKGIFSRIVEVLKR